MGDSAFHSYPQQVRSSRTTCPPPSIQAFVEAEDGEGQGGGGEGG